MGKKTNNYNIKIDIFFIKNNSVLKRREKVRLVGFGRQRIGTLISLIYWIYFSFVTEFSYSHSVSFNFTLQKKFLHFSKCFSEYV